MTWSTIGYIPPAVRFELETPFVVTQCSAHLQFLNKSNVYNLRIICGYCVLFLFFYDYQISLVYFQTCLIFREDFIVIFVF